MVCIAISLVSITYAVGGGDCYNCFAPGDPVACSRCGTEVACPNCGHCDICMDKGHCNCDLCRFCWVCNEDYTVRCPQCQADYAYCITCQYCKICDYSGPALPEGEVVHTQGTTITATGQYTEAAYTITVPAHLSAGETGNVTVVGAWKRTQTLKVSCLNKVTMSYGDQTFDLEITFEGINQVGSDIDPFNITKPVSVEDKSVLFGVWTGHLDYTVEFINN